MPKLILFKKKQVLCFREGTELSRLPLLDANIPLKFGCRQGHCGTCAIKIIEGENHLSPKTKQEMETLRRLHLESHRLACQCALQGDVIIDL